MVAIPGRVPRLTGESLLLSIGTDRWGQARPYLAAPKPA